jgi:hypothetical protein
MKMTSRIVVSCVSAMAFVAAWLPAAAHAADDRREASPANVCSAASVEEGTQNEVQESHASQTESQSAGSGLLTGYCYLDCSRCETNADCWSRGAGSCTSIPLCIQSGPLATLK